MKINDKSLIAYACSKNEFDKRGFLSKKGELNHSYKRRWFVLKGNLLFYFEQPDKSPLGMIVLENCSVEVNDADRFSFCIRYQSENQTNNTRAYILCAESENDMEQWMRSLASASYMFVAMVVSEFQKTLLGFKADTDLDIPLHTKKENNSEYDVESSITDTCRSTSKDPLPSDSDTKLRQRAVSAKPNAKSDKNRPVDMFTVTNVRKTKIKFKTLDTVRRSRSTENIYKINNTVQFDPLQNKNKAQSFKTGTSYISPKDNLNIAYENDKTTFEILHTTFGAAIWTRIGETL